VRSAVAVAVALIGLGLSSPGSAEEPPYDLGGGQGSVERVDYGTFDIPNGPTSTYGPVRYDYLIYTPVGWTRAEQLPVYVLVHGCGTTARQMMGSTLLTRVADEERFVVVYPDNQGGCWHAVSEDAYHTAAASDANITRGGGGEADIIAGITEHATARYNGDPNRVYMMGMSAGAFQTSATAAAYPELYAAIGENAGGGPGMSVACLGYPDAAIPAYARYGASTMGDRAHVMPFFAIGGTEDPLGQQQNTGGCVRLAYLQWLYINNIVKPAVGVVEPGAGVLLPPGARSTTASLLPSDTFRDDPASRTTGQVPEGWTWTRSVARGPDGCQVAEDWVVHGMGHYWSGGSTDPTYTSPQPTPTGGEAPGFNDPRGPSASQLSWDFFKKFTLKHGNKKCAKGSR
jgi:poly(3-hydroxybutyrate) depolymerase